MKIKYLIPILLIILVFSFGCTTPKTTIPVTTVEITTQIEEIETTATTTESSNIKYGLTENQRKQAFYDLAELQDSIALEDPPDRSEQMVKAYSTIAKQYGITKDEMMEVVSEGMDKNWPFPPLK
jgi:hypothetical protein